MADLVPITYIGPLDEIQVGFPEDGGPKATHGDTVEVPPDLAGKAPKGKPGDDNYDPGAGLLAQTLNWKPATAKEAAALKQAAKTTETE